MSYSTTLYAIDLDRLHNAIGSGDLSLGRQIEQLNVTAPIETIRRKEHWIAVREDGTITIDKTAASHEDVATLYATLEKHDVIHFLCNHTDMQRRLFQAFSDLTIEKRGNAAKINGHPAGMDFNAFHDYDDSIVEHDSSDVYLSKAVSALLKGKTSAGIPTSYYGYAAEQLCRVLGRRLEDEDLLGDISQLQLDSKLDRPRELRKVLSDGDFPIISYLTHKELRKEISQMEKRGIDFPEDADIDAARKVLLRCLKEAASDLLSVVTFYH